jgi:hypothetical protein
MLTIIPLTPTLSPIGREGVKDNVANSLSLEGRVRVRGIIFR